MKMTESAKELLENLRDEMQNSAGKNVRRMIIDFDAGKVSGVVQIKIGKVTHNRLIEFEEEEK